MKKLFFIAVLAGATLVSCTKNEVAPSVQQDEITFLAPVVGAQTKVNGLIGSTYNTGESFDVWCVHNTSDISEWGGAVYFSDVKAEHDGDLGGWALEDKYYWPATGKLSFVAMSPSITNTTTYDKTNGFSITTAWSQGANENAIVDLMYSDESRDNEKISFTPDNDDNSGAHKYNGVDLKFNHALSYITFKVKTAAEYSTTDFRLTKITLSGVYTTGTFIQKNPDPWTEDTTSDPAKVGTYIAFTNTPGLPFDHSVAVAANAEATKEIIILPQTLTAGQQKITVNYEISTDNKAIDDADKVWIPQTQFADLKNSLVDEWEMGKKYVYTLSIGMQEIIFDPAVTNWDAIGGGAISF